MAKKKKEVVAVLNELEDAFKDIVGDIECMIIGAFPVKGGTLSMVIKNGHHLDIGRAFSYTLYEEAKEDIIMEVSISAAFGMINNKSVKEIANLISKKQ